MQPPWTQNVDYTTKPIFVCWETTKACLLSCKHCRARAIKDRHPDELDTDAGMRLIDQIVEFTEPYPALLFTGGDPLMRPDLADLLAYARDRGVYTAVATSVTPLLTAEKLSLMRDLGVEIVSVSLDGAGAALHDRVRNISGTFDATLRAIESAKRCGMRLQVNTTVMKSNLTELADIYHLAKERGAVAWEVFFLIRTGRGNSLENPAPDECEEVAHFLYDATRYGIPVRTSEGPHFRRVYKQRQTGGPSPSTQLYRHLSRRLRELEGEPESAPKLRINATGDGKGILFVAHNGEVYPSGFLPISTGNVRTDNMKAIYTTQDLMAGLRNSDNLKGRCGACEYRSVCGGSRSRAYAEFNDPYQEDPACSYVPV